MQQQHQVIGFYQLFKILDIFSVSRSTWLNWVREGLAPAPVKMGVRSNAWPAHELALLSQYRLAGKSDSEIKRLVQELHAARVA